MSNAITEGKDRELPPDRHGEIQREPTPAATELQAEVLEAWRYKDAGEGEAMRARSSIESRSDLREAATNEAVQADPGRPAPTIAMEQDSARRWADLDASDFGRIRSDSRRENALEAIAGHMRASPAYAEELERRSPKLADAARSLNEELTVAERSASPVSERDVRAVLAIDRSAHALGSAETSTFDQRLLAQQDAQRLAEIVNASERHFAAATVGETARTHPVYKDELQRASPQLVLEAEGAAVQRSATRAIERNNAGLRPVPENAVSVIEAREAVKEDLALFSLLRNPTERYIAAGAIGENAQNQSAYRAELQKQAPEVAKIVQGVTAESERRSVEKDARKTAEFASMQQAKAERAEQWTPDQAAKEARKDLATLSFTDKFERQYALDDIAFAAEHSKVYRETLAKEAPDVVSEVETRREREAAERASAEQRKDSIIAAAQTRASLIDAAAMATVANVRTRETARVVDQLAGAPDTATQQLREAQQALRAPPLDGRVTAPDDPDIAAQQARALKRPVAEGDLSQALLTRYIVSHEKRGLFEKGATEFTFRSGEQQGRVAFVDTGKALNTVLEDKSTIRAMVEVATAKNWKEITVSGTDDFRRSAWLEASLNGMKVRGYEPREADRQLLAETQERKPANNITVVERETKREAPRQPAARTTTPERKHIDGDALTAHEKTVLDNSRTILNSKALGDQFTTAALSELEAKLRGERVYVGEVVDHGKAPYQFDKDKDDSYYVTLKTRAGEQVIWGKGLAEAMQERSTGDQVVLQNIGKRDVTVQERVRDAQGQVVATRPKESQLNAWKSELLSRFSEKARTEFGNSTADRQPVLRVYDTKAPRVPVQQPPAQARTSEQQRNPEQQRNSRER